MLACNKNVSKIVLNSKTPNRFNDLCNDLCFSRLLVDGQNSAYHVRLSLHMLKPLRLHLTESSLPLTLVQRSRECTYEKCWDFFSFCVPAPSRLASFYTINPYFSLPSAIQKIIASDTIVRNRQNIFLPRTCDETL